MKKSNLSLLLSLLAMAFLVTGCVGAAIEAASVAADAAFMASDAKKDMEKTGTTKAPVGNLWLSAVKAAEDLNIEIESHEFDNKNGLIKGHYKELDYIRVYIDEVTPETSKISIQARTALVPWDKTGYNYEFAKDILNLTNAYLVSGMYKDETSYTVELPEENGNSIDISEYFNFLGSQKTFQYQTNWNSFTKKSGTYMMTQVFLPKNNLKGEDVFPIKIDFNNSGKISSNLVYFLKDDKGICYYAEQTQEMIEPKINEVQEYIIKNNPKIGTKWNVTHNTFFLKGRPKVEATSFIENNNDIVSVPAGTFTNCLRVKTVGVLDTTSSKKVYVEIYDWYAPNVGWVKTITKEVSNDSSLGFGGKKITQLISKS